MVASTRRLHFHLRRANDRLTDVAGGRARRKTVVMLAAVLALSGADVGAVSALAPQLETAFRVNNAGIGLLVTVSSLVGALATLPVGVLADKFSRTRMLSVSIVVWGAAQLVSGFSVSFAMLLLTRLAVGAVTVTAGPTVTSLTGDLFAARDRSRMYGLILTGELLGAGLGVVVSGDIGAVSWRAGIAVLAAPSLALAWVIHRYFPEPARGGQSRLVEGADEILSAEQAREADSPGGGASDDAPEPTDEHPVLAASRAEDAQPDESLVHAARGDLSMWEAVRWVFRVPTNVRLILASSLGYFFLSGLRTFALIYARGRFGIGQGLATVIFLLIGVAAMAGVLVAGRTTDRFIQRGWVDARLIVGGVSFIVAAAVFVPALFSNSVLVALPIFLVAAFALAAPNPPIDAARLDVVPSTMWGRAESIRTSLRNLLESVAPLVFGVMSVLLGGARLGGLGSGVNASHIHLSRAGTVGLEYTFLIMLVPLAVSGLLLLGARRNYLTDVATAAASEPARRRKRLQTSGTPAGPEVERAV